jgi:succinate dehydrogenase flavin-adding protein (antitoxin of CptAB toxin-antitoxin module)
MEDVTNDQRKSKISFRSYSRSSLGLDNVQFVGLVHPSRLTTASVQLQLQLHYRFFGGMSEEESLSREAKKRKPDWECRRTSIES